jgi:Helix-turn-helix domain
MDLKQADSTLRNSIRPADLCSVRDAAVRARMSEFTVWKLIRQGKLRAFGRPGALRVSVDDLLAPYQPKVGQ